MNSVCTDTNFFFYLIDLCFTSYWRTLQCEETSPCLAETHNHPQVDANLPTFGQRRAFSHGTFLYYVSCEYNARVLFSMMEAIMTPSTKHWYSPSSFVVNFGTTNRRPRNWDMRVVFSMVFPLNHQETVGAGLEKNSGRQAWDSRVFISCFHTGLTEEYLTYTT